MVIVSYLVKQNMNHGVTYFGKCFAQLFHKKLLKAGNPMIFFTFLSCLHVAEVSYKIGYVTLA